MAPRKSRLATAAAAAATLLLAAAAAPGVTAFLPPPPFAPPGPPDPAAAASTEAAHGHLADLLAGVLLLREGGTAGALAALPGLHDLSKAYVLALEALEGKKGLPGFNASEWEGLTGTQAAQLMKGKAADAANASAAAFRAKVDALHDPLWESGVALETKLGGPHGANKTDPWIEKLAAKVPPKEKEDDPFLADMEGKLAAWNVEISDKIIEKPSKFRNFAALVMKHVSGAMLFDYAVDFNPCLISIMPSAAHLQATAINIAPALVEAMPTGVMAMAQGVNVQPALIIVAPMGVNFQPQGAQVAPFLVAVSPMGANVQPQGLAVAPAGKAVMPTGKQVSPQGEVYAPTRVMYMPVEKDITPGGSRHAGGHGGGGGMEMGGDGVGGGL